ncbi:hypothetical protein HHK36_017096 [Tetracentron sinense]|uniref:Transmembrane protein n=1 Tax=Tetracentron sinense TaxID=13715 RepID=A0A834Z246_TETSI|nr:hypothetical protein HHK36_017096 [Tetracentron sinense]
MENLAISVVNEVGGYETTSSSPLIICADIDKEELLLKAHILLGLLLSLEKAPPASYQGKYYLQLLEAESPHLLKAVKMTPLLTRPRHQVPFGYTRKDVLLIGLGVTGLGVGLKSGLEFVGVDPLQAGNVVQLVMVLGLTVGWISTYIFRVSNKEMTYAQQLRDYEYKVMEKRLDGLTEAEIEALLEQVEEEKRRLASGEQVN